jgi:hypothetical protein
MNERTPIRTWPDVIRFCEDIIDEPKRSYAPMLELVQFLARAPYASGLFPRIAGGALCVGKSAVFTPDDDELQVSFDEAGQMFTFRHLQRGNAQEPWSRSCAASEWRGVLERIVHKRLRWFHEG